MKDGPEENRGLQPTPNLYVQHGDLEVLALLASQVHPTRLTIEVMVRVVGGRDVTMGVGVVGRRGRVTDGFDVGICGRNPNCYVSCLIILN